MLDQVTELILGSTVTDIKHYEYDISLTLGEHKLWIESSWRIEKDGAILMGIENFIDALSHEDYADQHEMNKDDVKEFLVNASIQKVQYTDFHELTLTFDNGYILRSFQTFGDEDTIPSFDLILTEKTYHVFPRKIEVTSNGTFPKIIDRWEIV